MYTKPMVFQCFHIGAHLKKTPNLSIYLPCQQHQKRHPTFKYKETHGVQPCDATRPFQGFDTLPCIKKLRQKTGWRIRNTTIMASAFCKHCATAIRAAARAVSSWHATQAWSVACESLGPRSVSP